VTPRRILVVEDNPLNLKLVRDVLSFAGYDVVEAQSGEDGLRCAQEAPPDLVLMDLQLPGIDGTETLRRLREDTLAPDVPVIAVTALAMAQDKERAASAGFDGYIEKPISVRALPGQIEAFLIRASEATGRCSGASEATGRCSGASEATGSAS
jgi:two-component system, cell cycle response regulator DivK